MFAVAAEVQTVRLTMVFRGNRLHEHQPWPCVDQVPVEVTFNTVSPHLTPPDLAFRPSQELWWGGDAYAGVNYHNLRGFNFQFADDKGFIARLQFWAAGIKTNSHFRELVICLSYGTEEGGVWVLCAPDIKRSAAELDMLQANHPERFTRLTLKELDEHGRVWKVDEDGQASRGWQNVVVYPWHTWRGGKDENMDVWMTVESDAGLDLGKSLTGGVRVAMR
ncbi:uncharacterized protein BO95DRAFT_464622 [Aspergillus brunneoviolaceus CBS 621.78]|uniref:Uncharacterized protein n=1 Tax=Aspergillus brunneoviolaceus CBS 621.78 TaxID=1450534 RepID=A0ACD1G6I5_9EURO|nr:hypothetical protein BO95DRAFT_464622 [Aspergillus brunneoviolaceus CBS 621.78]RAH44843.1 hypothetical protein BO95DRAFT_464622 [Aspergillus brunneoviolaceus CBS 621.78]